MKKSILIITLFLLALTVTPALAQSPEGEEYIVQRGDWLIKIAEAYYGDGSAYADIVAATNAKAAEDDSFAVIRNPNLIVPGQKLWLPADVEGVAMAEAAPAPPADFGEAWESVSCDTFDVAPEVAAQADCGTVTVPENRSGDSDRTIQLAVVRVRSTGDNPGSPVILGTGGPGSNGLSPAADAAFLQSHADILADRDWIFFSQRGTQYAQPHLACPEFNALPLEAALNNMPNEERVAKKQEAIQACYDGFVAQGVDVGSYNSNENAADVDSIRQALGYDKIIYYGQSYGTLLGQFLLRNHPDILEAVIIDGVFPATVTMYTDVTALQTSFQRVFEACAADEACSAEYPDPEGALAEAYAALNADPQPVTLLTGGQTVMVDGLVAMNALFLQMYTPGGYGLLPTLAYQMRDNDLSALGQPLLLYLTPNDTARIMHYAIDCTDDPVASLDDLKTDNFADMYRDFTIDNNAGYVTYCQLMDLPQLPDSSDELVTSDVPTLLLQGGLDPVTPVAGGNNVETGLSNSYNVVFPAGTHIQVHDPCALTIMDAFMTDPLAEPDTSCVNPQYAFAVPRQVTATSPDGSGSLSVTLPAGFTPGTQANQYQGPTAILTFYVMPAGTPDVQSVEDALNTVAGTSRVPLDNTDIVDGEPVAGYPTKTIQAEGAAQGYQLGVDYIAFENEAGIYVIHALNLDPSTLERWRTTDLPAILQTVTVSGQ